VEIVYYYFSVQGSFTPRLKDYSEEVAPRAPIKKLYT
jgi:hypothetical protein